MQDNQSGNHPQIDATLSKYVVSSPLQFQGLLKSLPVWFGGGSVPVVSTPIPGRFRHYRFGSVPFRFLYRFGSIPIPVRFLHYRFGSFTFRFLSVPVSGSRFVSAATLILYTYIYNAYIIYNYIYSTDLLSFIPRNVLLLDGGLGDAVVNGDFKQQGLAQAREIHSPRVCR